uniref:Uncharacterized protein n=1 Tax=Rhizophora mucronata TaxID=61149 RepID=A0A2P2Q161_RHIMU
MRQDAALMSCQVWCPTNVKIGVLNKAQSMFVD